MKKQQVTLIVLGSIFLVLTAGVGWFLWQAIDERSGKEEELSRKTAELDRIYNRPVFPNATNIAVVKQNEATVSNWMRRAAAQLKQGAIRVDLQTPSGFKQKLQDTVRELSSQPGSVSGKICAPNFFFGFDRYLGESSSLPADTNVATRLAYQLAVIDKICKELYADGILEIRSVTRELFDDNEAKQRELEAQQQEEESRRNRRNRRNRNRKQAQENAAQQGDGTANFQIAKQPFAFEFVARPDAFTKVLNGVAAMEPFTVITKVEYRSLGDSLAAYAQRLKSSDDALKLQQQQEEDSGDTLAEAEKKKTAASAQPKRIIVTSPDLEPPLLVKIEVDVYSFDYKEAE
ncbi:MAG: Amuc_1100 family pilus-like protein [Kiritimatiellae bacterium]|nr:Amuc_1100 family pilus-like protein [Kiritimatiellia bacterium]